MLPHAAHTCFTTLATSVPCDRKEYALLESTHYSPMLKTPLTDEKNTALKYTFTRNGIHSPPLDKARPAPKESCISDNSISSTPEFGK